MEEHRISVSDNEPTNKCWLCHRYRQDFFLLWTVFSDYRRDTYFCFRDLTLMLEEPVWQDSVSVRGACAPDHSYLSTPTWLLREPWWPRRVLPEWEEPRAAWVPDCGSYKTPELTEPGLWTIIRLLPSLDPFPAGSGGLCTVLETYKPSSPMPRASTMGYCERLERT